MPYNDEHLGLIRVVPNEVLVQQERQAEEEKTASEPSPPETEVATYIEKCWQANLKAKSSVHSRLVSCQNQRDGIYDADKKAKIKEFGGSDVYINITKQKCRAVDSIVSDILFPPGEKPWGIEPTPVPDLPDEIEQGITAQVSKQMQESMMLAGDMMTFTEEDIKAKVMQVKDNIQKMVRKTALDMAKREEDMIEDVLVEGKFYDALRQFIFYYSTFPTAFLFGPIVRMKETLSWDTDALGMWAPKIEKKIVREWEACTPFDVFPSPNATGVHDGPLIIKRRVTRQDLTNFKGAPGYKDDQIDCILREYGDKGYTLSHSTKTEEGIDPKKMSEEGPDTTYDDPEGVMDALMFYGSVQGKKLIDWAGGDPFDAAEFFGKEITDLGEYEVTAMKIDRYVFKVVLNEDPLKQRNIFAASIDPVPDSIWGNGLPELMSDIQAICNGCGRALVNNMAFASGPMIEANVDRLPQGFNIEGVNPMDVYQVIEDKSGGNSQAIRFYQPNPMVAPLLKVFDYFFKLASEVTGIPAYVYGLSQEGGSSRTATGLSMLMNAANKGLRNAVRIIDFQIIMPGITFLHNHLLFFNPERAKMGDINIRLRASDILIMQEQLQIRRGEFLTITNNPTDMAIIGNEGRAKILKEVVRALKMPVDIIPDDTQLEFARRQQEITNVIRKIAVQFNIPVEQIAAAIQTEIPGEGGQGQGQPPGGGQPMASLPRPRQTQPNGAQMAGRDVAMYRQ